MIIEAIHSLRPNAKWVLRGESYDGLEWMDELPKPTENEILAEIERLTPFHDCYEQRLSAYPPVVEQLDMIFHDFDAWKSTIAEIKNRFPKP